MDNIHSLNKIKVDNKEYKDLDIYFTLIDSFIYFDNTLTTIDTLILRDCPLFAIKKDTFKKIKDYIYEKLILINSLIVIKIIEK